MAHIGEKAALGGIGLIRNTTRFFQRTVLRDLLFKIYYENNEYRERYKNYGYQKHNNRYDLRCSLRGIFRSRSDKNISDPVSEQYAAGRAYQSCGKIRNFENILYSLVYLYFFSGDIGKVRLPYRPDKEQITQTAQYREYVIKIVYPAVKAGRCPHTELGSYTNKYRQCDIRRLCTLPALFEIPHYALYRHTRYYGTHSDLINAVQYSAVFHIQNQLPYIKRYRHKHERVEIPAFFPAL